MPDAPAADLPRGVDAVVESRYWPTLKAFCERWVELSEAEKQQWEEAS